MPSLVLGSMLAFFPGVRSEYSVCRPLRGTDPLSSLRRALPSMTVTRE